MSSARLTLFLQREPAHYFGYVYFRQVKDSSVKRGYFQKVSHLAALGWCCCEAGLVPTCPVAPSHLAWGTAHCLGHIGHPAWAAGEGLESRCLLGPPGEQALLPALAVTAPAAPCELPMSLLLAADGSGLMLSRLEQLPS